MPATEVGDAVPVDATTIAFACTPAREVCTVSFDGRALALARTGVVLGAQDALVVADGVSHVARGASCTPLLAGGPSARCEDLPLEDGPGLSVDGVLADDLECDVLASLARDSVAIDPREPETDADVAARSRAGVVLLDGPAAGADDVELDLLVRGEHLAISYTRVDDTGAATQRRDLALALPAGSVDARPADVGGLAGWRVRVHTTFPIHYSHDCWQGFWVVRAWYEGGAEAFSQSYAEYGYCD